MTDAAFAALLVSPLFAVATRILYHIPFRLSRGFWKVFQVFLNFFSRLDIRKVCRLSALFGRPCYYTTMFSFCQEVFEKFLKNFFASLSAHRTVPNLLRLCARLQLRFSLPRFRDFPLCYCPFCDSSSIIPHSSHFVNTFLQSFWGFLEVALDFSPFFCGGATFYHNLLGLSSTFLKIFKLFPVFWSKQQKISDKKAKPPCKTARNAV